MLLVRKYNKGRVVKVNRMDIAIPLQRNMVIAMQGKALNHRPGAGMLQQIICRGLHLARLLSVLAVSRIHSWESPPKPQI
jgi:hypothetical protein